MPGRDAYLDGLLAESSEGLPDEHRAVMAAALLFSGEGAAVEVSIGWLLDPATSVRRSTANALEDAARKGKVSPIMLRRMITMRNWLPEDSRAALDAAIACRDQPDGGSTRVVALAQTGTCQADMGARRGHALEADLLAVRYRPRHGASVVAVRAEPDRVPAQWTRADSRRSRRFSISIADGL